MCSDHLRFVFYVLNSKLMHVLHHWFIIFFILHAFFTHLIKINSKRFDLIVSKEKYLEMIRSGHGNVSNTCFQYRIKRIFRMRCMCVFSREFNVRGSISLVSRWNSCNAHLAFPHDTPEFHIIQRWFYILKLNTDQCQSILTNHISVNRCQQKIEKKVRSSLISIVSFFWRALSCADSISFPHSLSQSCFWKPQSGW